MATTFSSSAAANTPKRRFHAKHITTVFFILFLPCNKRLAGIRISLEAIPATTTVAKTFARIAKTVLFFEGQLTVLYNQRVHDRIVNVHHLIRDFGVVLDRVKSQQTVHRLAFVRKNRLRHKSV